MRVAVDARCLAEPEGSGVAMYAQLMLNALAKEPRAQSISWELFTTGYHRRDLAPLALSYHRRHLATSNTLLNAQLVLTNTPSANRFVGGAQCLWQPNPMFFPRSTLPQYVTIHDLSFVHFPQFFALHTRWWYLRWVQDWLHRAPSNAHLLVVSRHTYDDVLETYPNWRGRVTLQMPPVPFLQPKRAHRGRYILVVGTLEPRKNIESLLAAYQQLRGQHPDVELMLVGRSSTAWRRYMRGRPMPEGVVMKGYVSAPERESLYAQAWCLVYPSFYEGFGLPPLEAMSWGVPAIVTATSSVPEYVGDAAILIDPYRGAEELHTALSALASDNRLYEQLSERGRERITTLSQQFSLAPLLSLWHDRT